MIVKLEREDGRFAVYTFVDKYELMTFPCVLCWFRTLMLLDDGDIYCPHCAKVCGKTIQSWPERKEALIANL